MNVIMLAAVVVGVAGAVAVRVARARIGAGGLLGGVGQPVAVGILGAVVRRRRGRCPQRAGW